MPEQKTAETAAETANPQNARKRAFEAIEKLSFAAASIAVFSILKENLDEKARFEIIGGFARKFKDNDASLMEIAKRILLSGSTSEKMEDIEKKDSVRFGYLKTLAYGLALFGQKGFEKAVEIMNLGANVRAAQSFGKKNYFLLHDLASMSFYMMAEANKKNKVIDVEKAIDVLNRNITNGKTEIPEKEAFIRWVLKIGQPSICETKSMASDAPTIHLIDMHIKENSIKCVPSLKK